MIVLVLIMILLMNHKIIGMVKVKMLEFDRFVSRVCWVRLLEILLFLRMLGL
jgi:hypothetical protein